LAIDLNSDGLLRFCWKADLGLVSANAAENPTVVMQAIVSIDRTKSLSRFEIAMVSSGDAIKFRSTVTSQEKQTAPVK
jgi:hypothetical protein